ncbi:unnamed protein product [Protopolystoma xenopodis]|uniref:Uncharacterized protein n=1 Tax=Protopolystoma xenopodis TaxID=117903 RepID=A0A448XL06_9PLAT|nr:unnamed protein product [Protopolystoma xenopodis]
MRSSSHDVRHMRDAFSYTPSRFVLLFTQQQSRSDYSINGNCGWGKGHKRKANPGPWFLRFHCHFPDSQVTGASCYRPGIYPKTPPQWTPCGVFRLFPACLSVTHSSIAVDREQ